MKRSIFLLGGMTLVATLFSLQARSDETSTTLPSLPASLEMPASIDGRLGSGNMQNVQITLASATQVLPGQSQATPAPQPAMPPEPAGRTGMFIGGLAIALMIAWRRCQWASLRVSAVVSRAPRTPQTPRPTLPHDKYPASPIGLSASHVHLPFGG